MATLTLGAQAKRYAGRVNWWLVAGSIVVTAFGIVIIQSAGLHTDPGEYRKQILYAIIGIGVMIGFSRIDYRDLAKWAPALYVIIVLLLAFILRGGHSSHGAQRWISLGPLGTFQPSEPAKLILAISIAWVLCKGEYAKLTELWKPLLMVAIPALLVVKQPDLGTALVFMAILTAQLFFGLPRWQHFAAYALGGAAAMALAIETKYILKPFQKARLLIFLNPKADPQGAGYNLNQSKIAVGSGGWFGRGLHHGTQTQLNFVPEHSTDFIFTVVGEELGFIGTTLLLLCYGVLLFGGIVAMVSARDRFGFLLASGIVAMFAFHIVVNIGMTIGIMPITGIPLPFLSYGGSAVLTDFAAVGVLLNIYAQKDRGVLGNA
jgi:rod shape determining protein RodA